MNELTEELKNENNKLNESKLQMENEIKEWKEKGVAFFIARLESPRAEAALRGFGLLDLIGENCIFHSVDDVIRHLGEKS